MFKKHRKWLDSFLRNCEKLNRSGHTIKNYRSDLERYIHFYEYFYGSHLNRANAKTIESYKEFLSGSSPRPQKGWRKLLWYRRVKNAPSPLNLGVNSQKRHLSSIKNFYDYLIQSHEDNSKTFGKNPVKSKIHTIKVKDSDIEHTKLLNHRDWDSLDKNLYKVKDRLVAYLLYFGGLRLEELCRLRYSDFSQRTKSLSFIRKGGERHYLKIREFETIFDLLESHKSMASVESEYLFTNKTGSQVSSRAMYAFIKRMLMRAGLSSDLTPHSFRKACATNMYVESKDILMVRNYLNHKDAKVTQTYIEY